MKRILISLFLFFIAFGFTKAQAATYDDAITQTKPSAILVYADWADNINDIKSAFNTIKSNYASKYIFVEINIATQDAKSFNKTNYIYPNLPYILLFKERGRMSRYLNQDCILSETCVKDKLDLFAN